MGEAPVGELQDLQRNAAGTGVGFGVGEVCVDEELSRRAVSVGMRVRGVGEKEERQKRENRREDCGHLGIIAEMGWGR